MRLVPLLTTLSVALAIPTNNNATTTTVTETPTAPFPTTNNATKPTSLPPPSYQTLPGATLICFLPDWANCFSPRNALGVCANFDPAWGAPSSLLQYRGVVCSWYRGFGCAGESRDPVPMVLDSRRGDVGKQSLGVDEGLFRSVECRVE